MLSQISKWGNSQGIRISKKIMQRAQIDLNDEVEIQVVDNKIVIFPTANKSLAWYLDGYENDSDRYDWGQSDAPKGRELI